MICMRGLAKAISRFEVIRESVDNGVDISESKPCVDAYSAAMDLGADGGYKPVR